MAARAIVGQIFSHYRVLQPLGAGGMGEVYRAYDTQLQREVAIKILRGNTNADAAAKGRLLREARTASQLNHPNICTIHEVGETDGQAFIAMELVAGESLDAKVRNGPLPTDLVVRYGTQLADAVVHAHKNRVIHRDLKSANIMVTPEDQVKILDFGLARRLAHAELDATTASQLSISEPGKIVGTLGYMSPEQLRGESADERSDIWALGVVLYEMVAATRPFGGSTAFEISSAILHQLPAPLPNTVPAALRVVIERCLEKKASRRYQSASELREALSKIESEVLPALGLVSYYVSRHKRLFWSGVTATVVLAALAAFSIHNRFFIERPIRSVAVLPLENLSGNSEQDYFADGIHEALINDLAKLSGLNRVTARMSVVRFRKSQKPLPEIARELGVDALITGSVQRDGDRVRVAAHLINAGNEEQLWTEQYDRPVRDVLSLEDDIVSAITRQIKLQLTAQEKTRLSSTRSIDPEAYEAYLKGLSALHRRTPQDLEVARQYFQQAIDKDPNFAAAYAGVAQVWGHRIVLGMVRRRDVLEQDQIWARKALELDDNSSEAHVVWGLVSSVHTSNWGTAEKEFRRGIELSPNDPDAHQYYSGFLDGQGRSAEALAEAKKAVELDPLSGFMHGAYSQRLLVAHRYDEAIAECKRALELNPSAPVVHHHLAVAYHMKGMDQQAFAEARVDFSEVQHDKEVVAALDKGYPAGGFSAAMRGAGQVMTDRSTQRYVRSSQVAELYALGQDKDDALTWLRRSLDEQELAAAFLRLPSWDFVRSDPAFQEIFQKRMTPQP